MAKFSGKLGYAICTESSPGIYETELVWKQCRGELISDKRVNSQGSDIVTGLSLSNSFSVIANPFIVSNLGSIVALKYLGVAWTISSVELNYPRLVLTAGGPYNE